MTADRKKAGVAFWATVMLLAALVYPLSYGPAEWCFDRGWLPRSFAPALIRFYRPMIRLRFHGPTPIREAIEWYYRVGKKS
jgi:hypothetical protein